MRLQHLKLAEPMPGRSHHRRAVKPYRWRQGRPRVPPSL